MSKINEILNTKTAVFENAVKEYYNDCLQIIANMAKNINYNAAGKKTFITFTTHYNGFKCKFNQYQQAQNKLRNKKAFNKRFANYKTIMCLKMSEYTLTMKTNGFYFVVTRETKNGFEKYKYDNIKEAKNKYHEFLTK